VDRKGGDVHPNGNPHYNPDPVYGQMIARGIAAKLAQLRPESAALFKANGNKVVATGCALLLLASLLRPVIAAAATHPWVTPER